jgi:eukaryotic-like serine/threonine-protein kinase
VARHWGLDDGVLAMVRRMPLATPVRGVEGDDDMLRTVASCANEAVDATQLPAPKVQAALQRVVQRYGRVLDVGLRDVQAALQGGAVPPAAPIAQTMPAPLDLLDGTPDPTPTLPPGSLRRAAAARAAGPGGAPR